MKLLKKISTCLVLWSIVIFPSNLYGQEDTTNSPFYKIARIEFYTYGGKLWLHREAMRDMKSIFYWGNELRLGIQTDGKKHWQQVFKNPSYGLGFYFGHFNNPIIGNPLATFLFMDFPFVRKEKYYLSTNWGVGLSYSINEYDEVNNNKNIAIGTDLNIYVDFMLLFRYQLSKRFEIAAGAKFQHFSNGSVKKPNLGLNMLSGTLALHYYPFSTIKKTNYILHPEPYQKYEFSTMLAYGINGIETDKRNKKYSNYTFSNVFSRRISHKRNIGIGIDIFYNEYVKTYTENDLKFNQLMSYAFILSSDMIVNKLRMTTQVGVYAYRSVDYSVPVYERVALRYYPTKNLFVNFSVKAHGFKAQFIEWGLGSSF